MTQSDMKLNKSSLRDITTVRFIWQGVGGLKWHGVMSRVIVNLLWPEITLQVERSFKLGSFIGYGDRVILF